MGFIDNIIKCVGAEEFPKEPSFRAVLFGENAVYLENILGIICYEKEQILLAIKKGTVRVKGFDLFIKKYCLGDVVVCGKITGIESENSR
jgi:sporulation protein YqfC